jgi:hypothetical protein
MIRIIGNKRYNSETAKEIAEKDHHNNGNYSGTTRLMATPKGLLFWWTNSNGQDLYLQDNIWLPQGEIDLTGFEITDEELAARYKLIEEG